MFTYTLVHIWNFSDGDSGITQLVYNDIDEAFKHFKELQKLIETDKYDFDVKFTDYCEGDMYFIAYESIDSLVNRQSLVLIEKEVY